MKGLMGIISLDDKDERLKPLTNNRPLAAVPFGGRYRLIDFILSNMVNSGVGNVGILVKNKYRSLMDHLQSGKEWDLARKYDGLFILPPTAVDEGAKGYAGRGMLEQLHAHFDYIKRSRQEYVIISGSSMVCNLNYRKALNYHIETGADITILYKEGIFGEDCFSHATILEVEADGKVSGIEVSPARIKSNNISMEMYIMSKELLVDFVDGCVARGECDLVKDGLIKNLGKMKIYGYKHEGYLARIYSIDSYYRQHMKLLELTIWEELFFKSGLVYTKVKDEAPTQYRCTADVKQSIVANGCIIEGEVENSIIARAVRVGKGAVIKNSIILQKTEIGENVRVENVICDKDVRIVKDRCLKGERGYPLVIEKRTVI